MKPKYYYQGQPDFPLRKRFSSLNPISDSFSASFRFHLLVVPLDFEQLKTCFLGGFFVCGNLVLLSFHPYEAGFYKPTILKVHPPSCRITANATMTG
jgi:hypothetical protein